jgi:hypothetical protein
MLKHGIDPYLCLWHRIFCSGKNFIYLLHILKYYKLTWNSNSNSHNNMRGNTITVKVLMPNFFQHIAFNTFCIVVDLWKMFSFFMQCKVMMGPPCVFCIQLSITTEPRCVNFGDSVNSWGSVHNCFPPYLLLLSGWADTTILQYHLMINNFYSWYIDIK